MGLRASTAKPVLEQGEEPGGGCLFPKIPKLFIIHYSFIINHLDAPTDLFLNSKYTLLTYFPGFPIENLLAIMPSQSDNECMFEILIRIETLCLESSRAALLGYGLGVLILGILLWLAGSYFSAVILGLLGAVVGSSFGLLVSQWLNTSALASMLIGALVFALAAVLFRDVLIILLACLVFSLAGATAYSSLILKETPPKTYSSSSPAFVQPFSQMDTSTRLAYARQLTEKEDTFFEKLRLLVKDTFQTISPYKGKIFLFAFAGGVVGLVLIWILKKLIMAFCYSGVGTLLLLIGLEVILLGMNVHLISWFQGRPAVFAITYLSLVAIGVIFQLMTARSHKRKKEPEEKTVPIPKST